MLKCPRMSVVDMFGASWDQCVSMVQYCFTSTETIRLVETESPRRPPRLSYSSWILELVVVECCFTSTETVGLSGTGAQDGHLDFHTAHELWKHWSAWDELFMGTIFSFSPLPPTPLPDRIWAQRTLSPVNDSNNNSQSKWPYRACNAMSTLATFFIFLAGQGTSFFPGGIPGTVTPAACSLGHDVEGSHPTAGESACTQLALATPVTRPLELSALERTITPHSSLVYPLPSSLQIPPLPDGGADHSGPNRCWVSCRERLVCVCGQLPDRASRAGQFFGSFLIPSPRV